MSYSSIIFDIDGTLTDSAYAALYSLQQAIFVSTGRYYERHDLDFTLGLPSSKAFQMLAGENWQEARKIGQKYYNQYINRIPLFPGIEETIIKLDQKNTRLGIVTSKTRVQLNRSFYNYTIAPLFQQIVCSDDTPYQKPHPEPLRKCMKLLCVLPEDTLYVGDTVNDYKCASYAGTDFGLAVWGCNNSINQYKNAIILNTPGDLLTL